MSELTFLGASDLMTRWGRSRAFIYAEVKSGRLSPSDRGRWPLAEVKRYERESYISVRRVDSRVDTRSTGNKKAA